MSRLVSRVGIRVLAVGVLVAGITGGVSLAFNRNIEARIAAAAFDSQAEQLEMLQLKTDVSAYDRATAQQREAQVIAEQKATALAQASAARAAQIAGASSRSQSRAAAPVFGPIPSSCSQYSGNQAIGCTLLLQSGFSLSQMPCLVQIWNHESGWNQYAQNPSGAYGIPQALPGSKMATYGSDWATNPATQIKWGLNYIKTRYSSPCGAWTFWQAHSWY